MVRNSVLFVCLLAVMVTTACKKKKGEAQYHIHNNSGVADLNIAVYASKADYVGSVNSIAKGIAPLGGDFTFNASLMANGKLYYVDAHSSDYDYSNWMKGDSLFSGPVPISCRMFEYIDAITTYTIDSLPKTNTMHCLFDNTKGSSTWKAYDAHKIIDGSPVWDIMSDDERYVKIIIRKDNTATFYYVAADTVTTPFTFGGMWDYPVFLVAPRETDVSFLMFNSFLGQITPDYKPPSLDSGTVIMHERVYYIKKV